MKAAVSLVVALAGVASADTQPPVSVEARVPPQPAKSPDAGPPPPPTATPYDENADASAHEANLEPNGPREGFVLIGGAGFGVMLGNGVGRGPAVSLRAGHVATQRIVITFELDITTSLHKPDTMTTLTDSGAGLFVGAQRYTSRDSSVWVRGAGGLHVFTPDIGKAGGTPVGTPGIGGLVGAGVDLARWGYVVLGVETFAMGSLDKEGVKLQLGFCTNLAYY